MDFMSKKIIHTQENSKPGFPLNHVNLGNIGQRLINDNLQKVIAPHVPQRSRLYKQIYKFWWHTIKGLRD